jgi:CHAT domain-containing protein
MSNFLKELAQRLNINDLISKNLEGIEEIIIIPHLSLHQIPFAALPIENGFLGDRFLIRYAPSSQILKFCHDRQQVETFQKNSLHKNSRQYGIIENATDDLYFTPFECEKIAEILPNSQRLKGRENATVSNYRQLAKQVNGLHSSHHASSRWDKPLESKLQLGDGDITLGELMSPSWRLPQLDEVFLSCCETNFGLTKITDDVLTLSAGFLCAGARSVINTLWSVDDLATALFSMFYYQFRQEGNNRVVSIRKSQVKLRTLSGDELKNKYYDELNQMLNVKKQQANDERQAIRENLKLQTEGTPEYEELEQKFHEIKEVVKKIGDFRDRLGELCKLPLPFEHPMYWAAFCCQGMG